MTTPTPVQQAEALWVRAHESVRRGDFAAAVRDLAACFKLLQAASDPRLPEVHRRWTEVHQLALEDAAQGRAAPAATAAAAPAPSLEAEAEAAANAGNLEEAITLYERALQKRPDNELVSERLTELKNARPRVAELAVTSSAPAVAPIVEAVVDPVVEAVVEPVVEPVVAAVVIAPVDVVQQADVAVPSTPINEEAIAASIDLDFDIDSGPRAPAPGPTTEDRFGFDAGAAAEPVADIHTAATLVPAPAQAAVVDAVPPSRQAEIDEISFADTMPGNAPVAPSAPVAAVAVAYSNDDLDDAAFGLAVGAAVEEPASEPVEAAVIGTAVIEAAVIETAVIETAVIETAVLETAVLETAVVETAVIESAVIESAVIETAIVETAIVETAGVEPTADVRAIEVDDTVPTTKTDRPLFSALVGDVASTVEPQPPLEGPGSEEEPISLPATHIARDPVDAVVSVETIESVVAVETIAAVDTTVHTRDTADLTVEAFAEAAAAQDAARAREPQEAPPMAAEDAPVGMPSIDVDIDMGGSVSADEASDMPVSADDLIMVGDDMSVEPILSMPPQAAVDEDPTDPVQLLETLLQRVRQNRRAA